MVTEANVENEIVESKDRSKVYRPSVDILETESELQIVADVPGVRASDIDIHFENGTLSLQAKPAERHALDSKFHFREYTVGNFVRTFQVSETIDASRIHAEIADGVLTLHLPKTEAVKPRKIAVTSAN